MSSISTTRWSKRSAGNPTQAGGLSIRDLERIRDENLVGILQTLKSGDGGKGWGAGKLLEGFRGQRSGQTRAKKPQTDLGHAQPIGILDTKVSPPGSITTAT
jgi:carnitine 3-dehydrogenase